MKQCMMTIVENMALTQDTFRMRLEGDVSAFDAPGQFLDIKLEGHFLRRPISLCDLDYTDRYGREGVLTIIYKVLGEGTEEMTRLESGTELDVLTGLGNGYDLSDAGEKPLLIGGGVGIPPLYLAAKKLREKFLKIAPNHPSSADIESENELFDIADTKAIMPLIEI